MIDNRAGSHGLVLLSLLLVLASANPRTAANGMSELVGSGEATGPFAPGATPTEPLRGVAYGPFREGQSPELGIYPTLEEVRQDMPLLKVVANGIRTYGCQNLQTVVTATQEIGLPLALGAWLSDDLVANRAEIECAVAAALTNSHITSLIAGNESILHGELTTTKVRSYVKELQERTDLPVTTAEPWHIWAAQPDLAACVDYLLVHIHPYWDCQLVEDSAAYVQEKYEQLALQYPEKKVVIGETGWPTEGTGREDPCGPLPAPSPAQQYLFAAEFLSWAGQEGIDFYFFEAFDEPWKCAGGRPEVECHWGIYDTDRVPKPARDLFVPHRLWLPIVTKGN